MLIRAIKTGVIVTSVTCSLAGAVGSILLRTLPLWLVVGGGLYLRHRVRKAQASQQWAFNQRIFAQVDRDEY